MEKTLSNPHFGNFAKKLTDPLFCAKKSQTNKSTSSKFYSIFFGGGEELEFIAGGLPYFAWAYQYVGEKAIKLQPWMEYNIQCHQQPDQNNGDSPIFYI